MEENNVCTECGYEGPEIPGEGKCPVCGGEMVAPEELGEEGKEEFEGEEYNKKVGEEEEFEEDEEL